MSALAGKTALVIGAGSGIGQASALLLAKRGASVVLGGRREEALTATLASIEAAGGRALVSAGDVTEPGVAAAMVERACTAFGALHMAVNAFGIGPRAFRRVDQIEPDEFERQLQVHVRGGFLAMTAQAPAMRAAGGGAIVNLASVLGLVGWAGLSAYAASKHALVGLSQVMAQELVADRVRVNVVCPSLVRSPMMSRLVKKSLRAPQPDPLLVLETEQVAQTIVWLVSEEAAAVTGQAIELGGGGVRRI